MKVSFFEQKDLVKLSSPDGVYFKIIGREAQLLVVGAGPAELTADEIVSQFAEFAKVKVKATDAREVPIGYLESDLSIRRMKELHSRGFVQIRMWVL